MRTRAEISADVVVRIKNAGGWEEAQAAIRDCELEVLLDIRDILLHAATPTDGFVS